MHLKRVNVSHNGTENDARLNCRSLFELLQHGDHQTVEDAVLHHLRDEFLRNRLEVGGDVVIHLTL